MPGQPAPLRENLAAAIVLASKWNPAEETFIDCMCGTGTILIEAALIKKKILPSYMQLRRVVKEKRTIYAFQDHVWFKNDQKLELWFRRFAESTVKTSEEILDDDSLEELPIIGVDQSDRAISSSSQHILKAGLDSLILLKKGNALEYEPKESYPTGVVVANPPYGKRLQHEGEGELRDLYHDLGETFKNKFKGYRAYILTPDPALRKAIALQTSARIPMFNGNIECRLLKYELY
jgi:23S rRNA G2445 N2-methylase RlmL